MKADSVILTGILQQEKMNAIQVNDRGEHEWGYKARYMVTGLG